MVVDGDRTVVGAAGEVDDAVGEDQPLDPDQTIVAIGAGAAEMDDVEISGGSKEGILIDRAGIISGVEAVIAVDQIVAGAAGELVVAIVAEQAVVAGAAVQSVDSVAAVDDVVAVAAVDRVLAVAAV